jgi:pimeloyl-ACP methyl ester carboxylesterase
MKNPEMRTVVFLPGSIMPAAIQYGPLLNVLKDSVRPILKDLEVYNGDTPPSDYALALEVEGLRQVVQAAALQRFHLVGYSGGGAVALAFTAAYPEKLESLALSEPAVIPSQKWIHQEAGYWSEIERVMSLAPAEQMREFMRLNLRPGVQLPPPPPGEPPAWMARRPAGLRAMSRAFSAYDLDLERFRQFSKPVYLAIGSLSNPIEERKAETMSKLFPDFRSEVYAERHHFDPPQRAEPERFAQALQELWSRAEAAE